MMKIGFDAKRLLFNQTGLGNYSRQWIEALMLHTNCELELYSPKKASYPNLNIKYPEIPVIHKLYANYWRSYLMGKLAASNKCDIFHGLSNEIPRGKLSIPTVCTIHDVIFKEFPNYYKPFDRWIYDYKTRYACANAKAIIVTSETTKHQLLKYYRVSEQKIHVVYQSIHPRFAKATWTPRENNPYLLYYSSFNSRKNHVNLIRAYAKIAEQHEMDLYLAGNGNALQIINQTIKELSLQDRVKLVLSPTNEELVDLLVHASGFVYPSLQEGFGIPLVEAASVGVPMVVSDIPIFRELTGEAAISYFNPYIIEEITESLRQLIQRTSLGDPISFRLDTLMEKTQSKNMAKRAVSVYESVL